MRAPLESSLSCTFCRAGRPGPRSVALDDPFLCGPNSLWRKARAVLRHGPYGS